MATPARVSYVRAPDGVHLAYRTIGSGPVDLLDVSGLGAFFSLDASDDQPLIRRFEEDLGQFCRLIRFDPQGIGSSDHLTEPPTRQRWAAHAAAVLDAVGNDAFLAEVTEKGERLRGRLEQFIGNYPELFEGVRGKGLMLGLKMRGESRPFYVHLRDNHKLLTVAAGDNTLRVLPPLVAGDAEFDEFFDKLSAGAASYQPPAAAA